MTFLGLLLMPDPAESSNTPIFERDATAGRFAVLASCFAPQVGHFISQERVLPPLLASMGYPATNHLRMIEECSSLFHVRGWVECFSAGLFLQEDKRSAIALFLIFIARERASLPQLQELDFLLTGYLHQRSGLSLLTRPYMYWMVTQAYRLGMKLLNLDQRTKTSKRFLVNFTLQKAFSLSPLPLWFCFHRCISFSFIRCPGRPFLQNRRCILLRIFFTLGAPTLDVHGRYTRYSQRIGRGKKAQHSFHGNSLTQVSWKWKYRSNTF